MEKGFLDTTFPFHFAVDPSLRITSVGPSLLKLAPHFSLDADFAGLLELVTTVEGWKEPSVKSSGSPSSLSTSSLSTSSLSTSSLSTSSLSTSGASDSGLDSPTSRKKSKGTVAAAGNYARLFGRQGDKFEVKLIEQAMNMRGQWAAASCGLVFLGTPVVKTNYDLSRFGLQADDFPAHAMATERIDATEKLATLLSKQDRAASLEQSLAYELTVAADLLIRFSRTGLVSDTHALDPNYLPLDQGTTMGKNVFEDYPEIAEMVQNAIEQLAQHGRPIKLKFDLARQNKKYYFEGRIAPSMNDHFVLVGRDVTDHRRMEHRLTYIAHHDPLTRLANRGFFERCVENVLQKATPCAVMLIDMNDFKAINDKHGHPVGDEVLKAIAQRLNGVCGLEDTPGRLGGDEFGVIVNNVSSEVQALQAARRFAAAIQEPLDLNGTTIHPRASVGVAVPESGSSMDVVYRNVDVAMYEAKGEESSEDCVLFSAEMLDRYVNAVRLKRDFGRALSVGELDVHYQPIKSLMTGEWYGLESLVRWQHPTRGMLAPHEFLQLAEETGDIFSIGEDVLRTACSNARRVTQDGRELMLTVNVSTTQLHDERMVDMLRSVLAETGWSPRRLTLEIPENSLTADVPATIGILNGLRGLGIRIAVDDFGMGQSSLRYLEELPIDMIKLDREMMARLDGDDVGGSRLIESVIRLGHTFGFDVVAEGVERMVQEAIVKSFGCRYAQGFLYSKPVPVEHLAGLAGLDVSLSVSRGAAAAGPSALATGLPAMPTLSAMPTYPTPAQPNYPTQ